jgi:PAS domain S-box-containing protein
MRLMESDQTKSRRKQSLRYLTPYLVLAAGLLFTFIVSYRLAKVTEAEDRARYQTLVRDVHASIESRLEAYTAVLRAGAGLFEANDSVREGEFRTFVKMLGLSEHYPGVQGMGFSRRIKPEDKAALVASRKREGVESFHLQPDYDRAEYHAIVYLEPQDQRNRAALGFDMFTEPTRREPMERARDSGLPAATGRVTLFQRTDPQAVQPGFIIYVPVYQKDQQPTTESERKAALLGFVFSAFRANDFFREIISGPSLQNIEFKIYDGPDLTADNLLYSSESTDDSSPASYKPRFASVTHINVGGRPWTVAYSSRPAFDLVYSRSWVPYTMVAGTLISLLFFASIYSQTRARAKAETSEAEVRESEAKARKILAERERAEAAVIESEERYRELVENANDIVFSLDLAGNVSSINRAVESITGYTQAELMGVNMSEFLTPASTASARAMTERKLQGEERTNYEVEVQAKDGHIFTLEISSRLAMHLGRPVGVQGVARDITTRRQAEEALRQADQRALSEYERLLERIAGLAQSLGTAHGLDVIFSGLREFVVSSVPCDGLFVSLYDPLRNVRTACYGWGDGQEIDTSDLPPMPVTSSGPNSRAVRTNQVIITNDYMAQSVSGPGLLVGTENGMRPQSSLAVPMSMMGQVIGTIEVQSYESAAYREEHATAMRMAANLTAVAIENFRLLERESNARANAEESNRLKDEFLATVSHELRTPLTAILGWSRMLQGGSLDDVTAGRAIETIHRNARAQAQIIDDILDVSRIITGNLYLELHPVELAPVLESAINVVRPTAEAKGIRIDVDFPVDPLAVPGDADRLQQVFWNLLSNAVKFTPSGGKVSVSLRQVDSRAEIEVADTGQGIRADFLPFVFERFRQADSTSTRQHGGLGLGLAIARHLIEIHGGSIEARSNGNDEGSTFTVRLPMVGSIPEAADATESVAGQSGAEDPHNQSWKSKESFSGIHVLIVDDDPDTLELLSAALTQRNARVTTASSAAEAMRALNFFRPDVLISDIAMPGTNGYELIQQVNARDVGPGIPAIAITAYAREEDKARALAAGYQSFLAKPVELGEFISAVAEASQNHLR